MLSKAAKLWCVLRKDLLYIYSNKTSKKQSECFSVLGERLQFFLIYVCALRPVAVPRGFNGSIISSTIRCLLSFYLLSPCRLPLCLLSFLYPLAYTYFSCCRPTKVLLSDVFHVHVILLVMLVFCLSFLTNFVALSIRYWPKTRHVEHSLFRHTC